MISLHKSYLHLSSHVKSTSQNPQVPLSTSWPILFKAQQMLPLCAIFLLEIPGMNYQWYMIVLLSQYSPFGAPSWFHQNKLVWHCICVHIWYCQKSKVDPDTQGRQWCLKLSPIMPNCLNTLSTQLNKVPNQLQMPNLQHTLQFKDRSSLETAKEPVQ